MSVVLGNIPDKTFGWLILVSLFACWALLVSVVLATDSRAVFAVFTTALSSWLLIIGVRMIQTRHKVIGWCILAPLALFLVLILLSPFLPSAASGIPMLYITLVSTGWAGYRLVRRSLSASPDTQTA